VLIKVTSIDNYSKQKNITPSFIKLDVEGAEYQALKGSVNTIKTFKPRLAISLYHKYNDLWELPLFIKSIEPSYQFYLGHHRDNWYETILYAI